MQQFDGAEQIEILADEGQPFVHFPSDAFLVGQSPKIHRMATYQQWEFATDRVAQALALGQALCNGQ